MIDQHNSPPGKRFRLLGRGTWPEVSRITEVLRRETVGGLLLLGATVVALVWANSGLGEGYRRLSEWRIGPAALHLDLTLAQWAADGLLAIFFFVAGLELKREFVAGDLRNPRRALIPVAAAVGGMVAPAVVYVLINRSSTDGALAGWAIPTATDIAFALAVLAVIGSNLPSAMRTFLLTLAVVDDLLAIIVIAIFYSSDLQLPYLAAALVPIAVFGVCVQRGIRSPWVLVPLGVVAWALMHASGIHATVAGVLLGFTVPVLGRGSGTVGTAERFEHRLRPLSAGFAVPVFAFFAAGVSVGGWAGLTSALGDRVTLGVLIGLVAGKTVGVLAGTALASAALRSPLSRSLSWWDVFGLAVLAGIGFTVSLLIGELAFGVGTERGDHVKVGVLIGSLLAAVLATAILRLRDRRYAAIAAQESADADGDGIPDCYELEED